MSEGESILGQIDDGESENVTLISKYANTSFLFLEISSSLLALMEPKIGGKLHNHWINLEL